LRESGIRPADRLAVLHPGSGGSARDWRPERFGELARRLSQNNVRVVVTGSGEEQRLVQTVVKGSEGAAIPLAGKLSLAELGALLERAGLLVANSTGPLHLAAAVGTAVIGFYPPIPQCSSRRWGPLTDRRVIFEPTAEECPVCRGGACRGDACMEMIKVEDVLMSALDVLERKSIVPAKEHA
jgi:ADP-heptose:LPS heptosyltransferase